MPITKCKETRRSKSGSTTNETRSVKREYQLWYADSFNEVEQYVETNLIGPLVAYDGTELLIQSIDLAPHAAHQGYYTASLDWSSAPEKERSDVGDETVSFDLSSATAKTMVSPLTVNRYAVSGSTAPDFQGGIGYDFESRKLQGCDVFTEQFSFTVNKILATTSITNAYIQSLRDTAFRWNASFYRGQATGEALFVGASGSPRDRKTYTINYKFLGSKNKAGLTLGGVSGISKQGWDYLWTLFADVEDTTAKIITPRPLAVYVERLYTSANFQAALGLQTGS